MNKTVSQDASRTGRIMHRVRAHMQRMGLSPERSFDGNKKLPLPGAGSGQQMPKSINRDLVMSNHFSDSDDLMDENIAGTSVMIK